MSRTKNPISLPSQLLIRNIAEIIGKRILIIGLPETETLLHLQDLLPKVDLTIYEYDYAAFRRIKSLHPDSHYGPWYSTGKKHDAVILYLPKSDILIEMMLRIVNNALTPGGTIYVIGEKNSGIKSSKKEIAQYIGDTTYWDVARHSGIYGAQLTKPVIVDKGLDEWEQEYTETINDITIKVISLPGVFSHGRLDEGTRLLLENLDIPENARVLDWGTGSGVIGAYIKQRWAATVGAVEMVDSNALAVESARRTIAANKLVNVLVNPSDIFSDVPDTYDIIVANPPFHGGVETDYTMVERFIMDSYSHLNKHGHMLIVANAFLRYKPLLEKRFKTYKIVAKNKRYLLYEVVR